MFQAHEAIGQDVKARAAYQRRRLSRVQVPVEAGNGCCTTAEPLNGVRIHGLSHRLRAEETSAGKPKERMRVKRVERQSAGPPPSPAENCEGA